jgi:hypothetical protein
MRVEKCDARRQLASVGIPQVQGQCWWGGEEEKFGQVRGEGGKYGAPLGLGSLAVE